MPHIVFTNISRIAFTLAEVLITLGIIGIIAALTLPTLVQNYKEKQTVTQLKKFNSIINQAFNLAVEENGDPSNWLFDASLTDDTGDHTETSANTLDNFWDNLTPYLKTVKRCKFADKNCKKWDAYNLNGKTLLSKLHTRRVVLTDGITIVNSWVSSPYCTEKVGTSIQLNNVCGDIIVDINGNKPPNNMGKDIFVFWITKYGFIPVGLPDNTNRAFENNCKLSSDNTYAGYGCTAWVLYNENMDYLHCDDLSWDGKTKCN